MNPRLAILQRILDTAVLRHRVIANNIANVNTPDYKRLEVTFEEELCKALAQGAPAGGLTAKVVEATDVVERQDGNTVDIDKEMSALSKNSVLYTAAAQLMQSRLASLRAAITGRS